MTLLQRAGTVDKDGELFSNNKQEVALAATRLYQQATNHQHDILEVIDAVKVEVYGADNDWTD